MITIRRLRSLLLPGLGLVIALALIAPPRAVADENDPPTRVARLGYLQGSVSFQPAGTEDWVAPPINRPLTTGDRLWSDQDGRAELQLDGSTLRLGPSTAVSFLNLSDTVTQIQLSSGTVVVRVRRLDDAETYEIDTPNLAFSVLRPGVYRITVDANGATTAVHVRSGQAEVTGGGLNYPVYANEYDVFSGTDQLVETAQDLPPHDPFDAWSANRDNRWERSPSAQYVSRDVVGYEDLDEHGTWSPTPGYGNVWYPRRVEAGWAPYHNGHWAYIAPWGYTWVDDAPWGYAPFHYGRWISVNGSWGWVPAPPQPPGAVYVRPVYAPALVAWVGVGAAVAWFALGPREVFVPSYPVSRNYVNNVNVSNTTVNTTVVNNIYNTTVINKTVTNITYVNRAVPGAVMATSSQAFSSGQPVARNIVRVDERATASAPVGQAAPATVPTKQAVLGIGRSVATKPPPVVQARVIVARTTPPPPPPTFERRQEAIKNNGGMPISLAQAREIPPAATARPVAVKIAPPAKMAAPARPAPAPAGRPADTRPAERPPAAAPPAAERPAVRPPAAVAPPAAAEPAARPPAIAIHPNEAPAPARPPSPSAAESVLERLHLQEQQQMHAKQEAERQQVQRQQELDHEQQAKQQAAAAQKAQLERQNAQQTQQAERQQVQRQQDLAHEQQAKQQAAAAEKAQLERQHEQQTQALVQKHADEQKVLREKQDAQKKQQERVAPPKG